MTVLRYSMLRTMLLFGCLLTLYLVGVRDPILLIGLTAVSSMVLSYFLLKGPRAAMAQSVADHAARRLAHQPDDTLDGDEQAEDREDDARRGDT